MIRRYSSTLKQLEDTELFPRLFEVIDLQSNQLIAGYRGEHPLRQADDALLVYIRKINRAEWILDGPDAFYANRAMISLRDEPRVLLGMYDGNPRYAPGRKMVVQTLEDGIPTLPHLYTFLPCNSGGLGQYTPVTQHHLTLARDEAQRLIQRFKDTLRVEGLLPGESEALGLDSFFALR